MTAHLRELPDGAQPSRDTAKRQREAAIAAAERRMQDAYDEAMAAWTGNPIDLVRAGGEAGAAFQAEMARIDRDHPREDTSAEQRP